MEVGKGWGEWIVGTQQHLLSRTYKVKAASRKVTVPPDARSVPDAFGATDFPGTISSACANKGSAHANRGLAAHSRTAPRHRTLGGAIAACSTVLAAYTHLVQ